MNKSPEATGRQAQERVWSPEGLSEERLKGLLPHTTHETVSELEETLRTLAHGLSLLPSRHNRNRFIPREGGPTKKEYVLYAQGSRLAGEDYINVLHCLEKLAIEIEDIDALEREIVVTESRGKIRLELLGLVAGVDVDAELSGAQGSNWETYTNQAMAEAAQAEFAEAEFIGIKSHRRFPIKGSSEIQQMHPELKRHFAELVKIESEELDPIELDMLIDDSARRFEAGEIGLQEAFDEFNLEYDDPVGDNRLSIPAARPMGERLGVKSNSEFRWKGGSLYQLSPDGKSEVKVENEELIDLYKLAKPVAEKLWQAHLLSRKAERISESSENAQERVTSMQNEVAAIQAGIDEHVDELKPAFDAIDKIIKIHRGYAFRRVMRFLKRKDVNQAGSFGPDDLMQEAVTGIYRAIGLYDEDGGASFIGFARHHIDAYLLRYIYENRVDMRTPAAVQTTLHKLYDINDKADEVPEDPDEHAMSLDARRDRRLKLAREVFGPKFNMAAYLDKVTRETHIDTAEKLIPLSELDDEFSETVVDMKADDLKAEPDTKRIDLDETRNELSKVLHTLTPREERVIRMRFGIGIETEMTLEEVGQSLTSFNSNGEFGVSRERVRQIEAKALRKIRQRLFLKYGVRDDRGNKYVDMYVLSNVFHV